jgi:hypothetical protein
MTDPKNSRNHLVTWRHSHLGSFRCSWVYPPMDVHGTQETSSWWRPLDRTASGGHEGGHWVTLFRHSQKPSLVLQFLLKASSFKGKYTASILGPWYPMISHHPSALIFDLHLHRHICGPCNSLLKWAAGDMGWTSSRKLFKGIFARKRNSCLAMNHRSLDFPFNSLTWEIQHVQVGWFEDIVCKQSRCWYRHENHVPGYRERGWNCSGGKQQYKRDNCHM